MQTKPRMPGGKGAIEEIKMNERTQKYEPQSFITISEFESLLNKQKPVSDRPSFDSPDGFDLLIRQAEMFANSDMVPVQYRRMVLDKKTDKPVENPQAIPNCVVALDLAGRLKASALMVMQNLHVIEGRPSWSAKYVIAAINACGRFSPLRFELSNRGRKTVQYEKTTWEDTANGKRYPKTTMAAMEVDDITCIAWATEKATGLRVESVPITMDMVVSEGWIQKNGSKWKTMPEQMFRYRSASFFGNIYAPDLLMGLPTADEVEDIVANDEIEVKTQVYENINRETGEINPEPTPPQPKPEPPQKPVYDNNKFIGNFPAWADLLETGKYNSGSLITMLSKKATLTDWQTDVIKGEKTLDQFLEAFEKGELK